MQNAINRPLKITEKSAKNSITTPFLIKNDSKNRSETKNLGSDLKIWGPISKSRVPISKSGVRSRKSEGGVRRIFEGGPGEIFWRFRMMVFDRSLIENWVLTRPKVPGGTLCILPPILGSISGGPEEIFWSISRLAGVRKKFLTRNPSIYQFPPFFVSFGPFSRVQLTHFDHFRGPQEKFLVLRTCQ